MDGITKITERINAAAAEECAVIAKEAEESCAAIRADFAQKAEAAYESGIQSGEIEVSLDAERIVRNAKLNARKEVLAVKQELLDAAFEAAKKKVAELPEDKYVAWLVAMAAEASEGCGEIILSQKDSKLGNQIVAKANEALAAKGKKGGLTVSTENRDMDAGFVLRDGNLELNCTLGTVLAANREKIATKVASDLFC